jgi:hypothetical protein
MIFCAQKIEEHCIVTVHFINIIIERNKNNHIVSRIVNVQRFDDTYHAYTIHMSRSSARLHKP